MKNLIYLCVFLFFSLNISCIHNRSNKFIINTEKVYVDSTVDELVKWGVNDFADDIKEITGKRPEIIYVNRILSDAKGIYIGACNSKFINDYCGTEASEIEGKWETFMIQRKGEGLFIAGSDTRGIVFGIFDLAERLGISPWKWWADVHLSKQGSLTIELPTAGIVSSPSVQYRGIFLNDEDWGLQPWAAKTFEPETGDIGPKTYEKIFQLLLRLKANTIWPAMHQCTSPFFMVEGNKEMAEKYHIVIGSSHAEPMLRNNVREWNKKERGAYNYFTNSQSVEQYWQERVDETKKAGNECLFTIGMRGVHDSKMEGASSKKEMVEMMNQIIADQRDMLSSSLNKPNKSIPQVLVPYKEVLDLYNNGLQVPEDVTLMWCDDNYGYIRRFCNEQEKMRSGGAGVYYHLSYWGRPHDYLWLSTTQPGLIWYEMTRAYQNGANKIWIANVGDIKPAEYNMEFFMDLAWDINSVNSSAIKEHMIEFYSREFGAENGKILADIMDEYYRLAFLRKPEYMGWSQTEPTTQTQKSDFNQFTNGNEVQRRIDGYQRLVELVDQCKKSVRMDLQDAFFQLVEYPVKCAASMNFKYMNVQLSYYDVNDKKKKYYNTEVNSANDSIVLLTDKYNKGISNSKWEYMMDHKPRKLPVFQLPEYHLKYSNVGVRGNGNQSNYPVFVQAKDFTESKGVDNFNWVTINGLGYSNSAITLQPFSLRYFNNEKPSVDYHFEVKEEGKYEVEIRCLPTHSNNIDHMLTVSVDNNREETYSLNTKGRSKEWKENVLRNYRSITHIIEIPKGKHTLKLSVNQTGIVIDQIAVTPEGYGAYYEIPL